MGTKQVLECPKCYGEVLVDNDALDYELYNCPTCEEELEYIDQRLVFSGEYDDDDDPLANPT